jgi:prolipoprotein diacylglyceryltransferase
VLAAVVWGAARWETGKRGKRPGAAAGALSVAYGVGRFGLDWLRVDEGRFGGLTAGQVVCVGVLVPVGVWLMGRGGRG